MKLLWGMSASFCNVQHVLKQIEVMKNHEMQFVCSHTLFYENSRFQSSDYIKEKLSLCSKYPLLENIHETELLSMDTSFDAMILAPCTANTLAKLVNGIYDNGLLVSCKMMLRNQKPIIIGYASNDGMGIGAMNVAKALQMQGLYLVPFGQDDWKRKENSIVCDWALVEQTVEKALVGKQLQPVLLRNQDLL